MIPYFIEFCVYLAKWGRWLSIKAYRSLNPLFSTKAWTRQDQQVNTNQLLNGPRPFYAKNLHDLQHVDHLLEFKFLDKGIRSAEGAAASNAIALQE